MCTRMIGVVLLCLLLDGIVPAQQPQPAPQTASTAPGPAVLPPGADSLRPDYVLGVGDQILIRSQQAEELHEKVFRVSTEGDLILPLIGQIRAAGVTVEQVEQAIAEKLKTYIRNPQVLVTVTQFRIEPVFLVGAFRTPGIFPLQGRRTLVELLTQTGGVLPNASRRIKLIRRIEYGRIPLPTAVEDPEARISSVEISIGSLQESVDPALDIALKAYDMLTAERAELVYVNGQVARVGGFELGEKDSISAAQLITLAGGLGPEAAPERAKILRPVLNTSRRAEIPLNLKRVLEGKDSDFPLTANDLLYVPRNDKRALLRQIGLPIAVALVTTLIFVAVQRR